MGCKYEEGQFVQQRRRDHQMNAWRCAGVVLRVFGNEDPLVCWLEFDRNAYQLVWPKRPLATGVARDQLLPLEPEKSVVPIADSVHAEVMKLVLS